MINEPIYRTIRIVELVAEELEKEAARMPPSYKEHADALLLHAKTIRESTDDRKLRIWNI